MALAAFVMGIPVIAYAGVAGTPHDLRAGGGNITAQDLCFACHIPHNAGSEKLWARTTGSTFTGVQELCYSCHDGTSVVIGSDTVMDPALMQHKTVGADCSGDGACHDVHGENAKFLAITPAANSLCETCHAADPGAPFTNSYLAHQTAVSNHPMTAGTFTCNNCHMVHGASSQTDLGLFPTTLTNPILRDDNTSGGYYGAMCIECHSGGANTDHTGAAWASPTNTFAYGEATVDGTETKHPTINTTASSSNWSGTPINGCDNCHDVHNGSSANEWILITDNTNSAFCMSCHNGSTAPGTTGGGGGSHFTGVVQVAMQTINSTASPALPWASQQNDSPKTGLDYSGATDFYMACQTCHSVHRAGVDEYFLRNTNGTANAICSSCHTLN